VIGTEVPVPGGAKEHHCIQVTSTEAAAETTELTRKAFYANNLQSAWEKVIAQVVQPGVEFGDDFIHDYEPEKAKDLCEYIQTQSGMVFEAHSTDYQTGENLQKLVAGHFAILKVGPELTFAFREAIFGLAQLEKELVPTNQQSQLLNVIDSVMLNHPENWQKYYPGTQAEQAFARKFSLSDRIRYYWPQPEIQTALERMMLNLRGRVIPISLISQLFSNQYEAIRSGEITVDADALIENHILRVIHRYDSACGR
jgi:D-tagatose-1,6-bisphosphate aldolase subunit GatZ/KbaZ